MAIRIDSVNAANADQLGGVVVGDGSSTVLVFNADEAPFFVDYKGKLPDGFESVISDPSYTATIEFVDTHAQVTVTFDSPPSDDPNAPDDFFLQAFFNSL